MFELFTKKPFLSTFVMCLLFFITAGIFFENRYIDILSVNYLIITFLLSTLFKQTKNKLFVVLISLLVLFLHILLSLPSYTLLITEIGILISLIYHKKENKEYISLGIICASFLFHLYLVENTPINKFQHDLTGIYLYMDLISRNIINIKDFDPWYMYYMFHQPLHFIVLHNIQIFAETIFSSQIASHESLQYLSLFYVTATTIFFAKIFVMLKFNKIVFYAILLITTFHPTFALFSVYISDDVPVLFFSTMTFYFLIRWYKTNKFRDIKIASIAFGLSTLSKLSMLLSVPAISLLFLIKLIKNKSKRTIIIKSISLFITIAVPLSLIWVIRNHILYDMQFYNIPDTSPMGQNFRYLTLFERLTDFSLLFKPFMNAPYISDANILLAIFKTEIFGEWNLAKYCSFIIYPAAMLYAINLFLQSTTIVGGLFIVMKKNLTQKAVTSFFVLLYFSSILYALKYAMDFPYICSSNYRLFTLLLLSEAVILGKIANQKRACQIILLNISVVYALLSFGIYILVSN